MKAFCLLADGILFVLGGVAFLTPLVAFVSAVPHAHHNPELALATTAAGAAMMLASVCNEKPATRNA